MNRTIRGLRVAHTARAHGRLGQNLPDEVIEAILGPRPSFDPVEYAQHGFVADALGDEDRLEEIRNAFTYGANGDGPEGELVPVPVLWMALVFFLGVEAVAATRLFLLLGLPPTDRIVLGAALAGVLVALTSGVHRVFKKALRGWSAAGVVISYASFLVATAWLRLSDLVVGSDGPTVADGMSAVILVLSAAGPAWMAELFLQRIRGASPNRQSRKLNSRELRSTDRRVSRAQRDMSSAGRRQQKWDQESAQLHAIYHTNHAKGSASRNGRQLDLES